MMRDGLHLRRKIVSLLAGIGLATMLVSCGYSEEEEAMKQKGVDALGAGDYAGAVTSFNSALSMSNGRVRAEEIDICYYKAAAQYLAGEEQEALNTYTALLRFDEKNVDAYYLRGMLYAKMGNAEKAKADFDKAMKLDPKDYERYLRIYRNLASLNMGEMADQYLDKLLQTDSTSKEAYSAKGMALEIRGDYDSAAENYEKALKKGDTSAYIDLARIQGLKGEMDAAASYLKSYQKEVKPNSLSYNAVGQLELSQGNYADALESFQKGLALEKVTNRQELRRNEIIALEYTGDFAQAKEKAASYVCDYPADQEMLNENVFLSTR